VSKLTLIYYTANRVNGAFADRVRERLLKSSGTLPIISVSQKPLDFGQNICVGDIGFTPYNVYRQILQGAQAAKSEFIACCEDDTLYPAEHFSTVLPEDDVIYYNIQRWWLEDRGIFRWRDRSGMCACIAPRKMLIDVLRERFEKYPEPPPGRDAWRFFGEPGRTEKNLGLPPVKHKRYQTAQAIVTVNHRDSLGGKRKTSTADLYVDWLPGWGGAKPLWEDLYGRKIDKWHT
jgi:hypothetical protein